MFGHFKFCFGLPMMSKMGGKYLLNIFSYDVYSIPNRRPLYFKLDCVWMVINETHVIRLREGYLLACIVAGSSGKFPNPVLIG